MAIKHTFKTEDEILIVTSVGTDDSLDEVLNLNEAILQEAIKCGYRKVLSDERLLIYDLSIIETFMLGDTLSKRIRFIEKIALVISDNQEEMAMFWENVTVNRKVKAKVFVKYDEAVEWLLKD
jgi:hypothetical protein